MTDRQRVDAFLRRSKKCGYCSPDLPTFQEQCDSMDQKLFNNMEAGIKDHLLAHMKNSGALSNSQHGLLTSKSTTTHLVECSLDWNLALRSRKAVDIIYLDFAKAFDSVVHSKLVAKLNSYGVNNVVLR